MVYSAAFLPAGTLGGTLTTNCVLMESTKDEASSLSREESALPEQGRSGEGTGGGPSGGREREDEGNCMEIKRGIFNSVRLHLAWACPQY